MLSLERDSSKWILLDEIDSTNRFLSSSNVQSGSVCIARSQTKGRGRLGRSWVSQESKKSSFFLFSTLLHLAPEKYRLNLLSLLTGFCVLQSLTSYLKKHPLPREICLKIKWPNDIYAVYPSQTSSSPHVAKIGGILIESHPLPSGLSCMIIGVGLNWKGDSQELLRGIQLTESTEGSREGARVNSTAVMKVDPSFLYESYQENIPPPLSFSSYFVDCMNQYLVQLDMNHEVEFLKEWEEYSYLQKRLVFWEGETWQVKGVLPSGFLLLSSCSSGRSIELASDVELEELI